LVSDSTPVLTSQDDESDKSEGLEEAIIKNLKQEDDMNSDLKENTYSVETFQSSSEEAIIKESQRQNTEENLENFNTKENSKTKIKSEKEEELHNILIKETNGTKADIKEVDLKLKKQVWKEDIETENIGKTTDDEEQIKMVGKINKLQNKTDNVKMVECNLLLKGEDEETIISNLDRKWEIQIRDTEENCFKQKMLEPIDNYQIEIVNLDEREIIQTAEVMLKSVEPRPKVTKGSHIFTGELFKPEIDRKQPEKNNLTFQKSKNQPNELHPKDLQDEVSPQLKENKPIENNIRVIDREYKKYKTMLTLHRGVCSKIRYNRENRQEQQQ